MEALLKDESHLRTTAKSNLKSFSQHCLRIEWCFDGAEAFEEGETPAHGSNDGLKVRRRRKAGRHLQTGPRGDKGAPASKSGETPADGSNDGIRVRRRLEVVKRLQTGPTMG
ncbi:hypothetical protein Y032_0044g941 [Ancylostoma ceylanicum]|uniref:Uncharacterized protein n=1 Tax=Ancylostoma ceylanicum TaxID=53326 RepID=A0A016UFF7_9BILA|nr:hypothetical protein Y032_0044g941 [Ancylostoma ceylanicum]